jgi:hypothetical protein
MNTPAINPHPSRRAAAAAAALLLVALVALALQANLASGKAAVVIGETGKTPKPSCPTPTKKNDPNYAPPNYKICQAVGEVTGLQKMADGRLNPYKVRQDGRLVAWSVDLSRPSSSEMKFFTDAPAGGPDIHGGVGGGNPSGRISVLKKLKHQRFKLVKQSAKVDLSSQLGREPILTLDKPIKVKAGRFVAITTSNWLPDLAHDEPAATPDGDVWLASRGAKHCGGGSDQANQDAIDSSKPHQKLGSIRSYRCTYTAARLLYNAYFVPTESGKN